MDASEDPVFRALLRESALIAEHLGIGATALGKASFGDAAAYYAQAFFALSVGIERGAKLALSINAALNEHGSFLAGEDLRRFGHDLDRLLHAVEEVAKERELSDTTGAVEDATPKFDGEYGQLRDGAQGPHSPTD